MHKLFKLDKIIRHLLSGSKKKNESRLCEGSINDRLAPTLFNIKSSTKETIFLLLFVSIYMYKFIYKWKL